jgi:hypothetical protein
MTRRSQVQLIVTGMIGNALEWYDFAIYGHEPTPPRIRCIVIALATFRETAATRVGP